MPEKKEILILVILVFLLLLPVITLADSFEEGMYLYDSDGNPIINISFDTPSNKILYFHLIGPLPDQQYDFAQNMDPPVSDENNQIFSFTLREDTPPLDDGIYNFSFQSCKINESNDCIQPPTNNYLYVVVDTVPPEILEGSISPVDGETINTTDIPFAVSFSEAIDSSHSGIEILEIGTQILFYQFVSNQNNEIFSTTVFCEPYLCIENGDYTLKIIAVDFAGHEVSSTTTFSVYNETVLFEMVNPRSFDDNPFFGVAISKEFDLNLSTMKKANCSYSFTPNDIINPFDITGENEHVILDLSIGLGPGTEKSVWTSCLAEGAPNASYQEDLFTFTYYDEPCELGSAVFEPPIITYGEVISTLSIQASCPVVCNITDEESAYDLGLEESNLFSYYNISHSYNVEKPGVQTGTFTYDIYCENLAGIASTSQATFTVDMGSELTILVNEPQPYYSAPTDITLDVTTNKPSTCQYEYLSEDGEISDYFEGENVGTLQTEHLTSLGSFGLGTHDITISCTKGIETVNKQTTFIIDASSPSTPVVESDVICDPTTTSATWISSDEESGIQIYEYSVYQGAAQLINATQTTSVSVELEDLNLSGTTHIFWKVKAQNNVGDWSAEGTGETQINTQHASCDTTNPIGSAEQIQTSGGVLVNLSCYDSGLGCDIANFYYGISYDTIENCDNTQYPYTSPILFIENGFFCWQVSDLAGHNSTGQIYIEVELIPHCLNEVLDEGLEAAIDCGLECAPCITGFACLTNLDCQSNYCLEGICTLATCEDELLNQDESDVDCGGICTSCGVDFACILSSDCETLSCVEDLCVEATCTDVIKNQNETDVDCGGSCDPCIVGLACLENFDCETEYCADNLCLDSSMEDSDEDGMPNGWEEQYNLNPYDPGDASQDLDGDELTNLEEFNLGTDPTSKDTDDDGYNDNIEVEKGTDPTNPYDYPESKFLKTMILSSGVLLVLGGMGYLAFTFFTHSSTLKSMPRPLPPMMPPRSMVPRRPIQKPFMKGHPRPRRLTSEQIRRMQEKKRKHEEFMKKIREKAAQRTKLVKTFSGSKLPIEEKPPTTFEKPPMPTSKGEWLDLETIKEMPPHKEAETIMKHISKPKVSEEHKADLFDRLSELSEKEEMPEKTKKKVFDKLSELTR